MMYSNVWLQAGIHSGRRISYLYFWGHQPATDGKVSASCFSQWWPSDFCSEGVVYRTAEHWMMASKARLFGDAVTEEKILAAQSPAEAKKLGRKVGNFDPEIWDERKFDLVVEGNKLKFAQNADLLTFLLNTGDRVLVEASPVDAIWGIGLAANDARAQDPQKWRGENLLGYALMEVRDRLNHNLKMKEAR